MSDDVTLFGKLKNKLIDSKQKWAESGRLLTGKTAAHSQRLPPGQRQVENWPVLDLGIQPEIPTHAWRLFVDGEVESPTTWKWGEFTDLPKTTLTTDIHCVTAWSRYDNKWEGVSARDLLKLVKPKAEAQHVIFHSYDTYTTNVPLADFAADDVMLAWSWNGEPISREHGGPLARGDPQALLLEERQVDQAHRILGARQAGLLGSARLSQLRRSVARAALRRGDADMASAHDFTFTTIDNKPLDMKSLAGKPVLVVNVASYCGFTPQYTDLEKLHETYGPKGLVVLGVPSNDFGAQEPRTEPEIAKFCETMYGVKFPLTSKQKVIGPDAHALYQWIAQEAGEGAAPKWNFHKYLIGKDGSLQGAWPSRVRPGSDEITGAIEKAL